MSAVANVAYDFKGRQPLGSNSCRCALCSFDASAKVLSCGCAVGLLCLHGSRLPAGEPVLAAYPAASN